MTQILSNNTSLTNVWSKNKELNTHPSWLENFPKSYHFSRKKLFQSLNQASFKSDDFITSKTHFVKSNQLKNKNNINNFIKNNNEKKKICDSPIATKNITDKISSSKNDDENSNKSNYEFLKNDVTNNKNEDEKKKRRFGVKKSFLTFDLKRTPLKRSNIIFNQNDFYESIWRKNDIQAEDEDKQVENINSVQSSFNLFNNKNDLINSSVPFVNLNEKSGNSLSDIKCQVQIKDISNNIRVNEHKIKNNNIINSNENNNNNINKKNNNNNIINYKNNNEVNSIDNVGVRRVGEGITTPGWRKKEYKRRYVIEGSEDLGDSVFTERHQRGEAEEKKRRKRDEKSLLHSEKLSKYNNNNVNNNNKKNNSGIYNYIPALSSESKSFFFNQANLKKLKFIEIYDVEPRGAFGFTLPPIPIQDFTLPPHFFTIQNKRQTNRKKKNK